MEYLHTMVRIRNIEESLEFYCGKLGMVEHCRMDNEEYRFTLIFLAAPGDVDAVKAHDGFRDAQKAPLLELTYNWPDEEGGAEQTYDRGSNFGHLAFRVDNIYETCQALMDQGVEINRPPREGLMAFVKSPDGISIELLQKGGPLPVQEPWASMQDVGTR